MNESPDWVTDSETEYTIERTSRPLRILELMVNTEGGQRCILGRIDLGCDVNLVHESLVRRLKLSQSPMKNASLLFSGIAPDKIRPLGSVKLTFQIRGSNQRLRAIFFVVGDHEMIGNVILGHKLINKHRLYDSANVLTTSAADTMQIEAKIATDSLASGDCPELSYGVTLESTSISSPRYDLFQAFNPDKRVIVDYDEESQQAEIGAISADKDADLSLVQSDDEDIASQATVERSSKDMWAERYLADLLSNDENFQSLCHDALTLMSRDELEQNMRRLLKGYRRTLSLYASTDGHKAAVALLRRRISRSSISRRILTSLTASTVEEKLHLRHESRQARNQVIAWLQGVHPAGFQIDQEQSTYNASSSKGPAHDSDHDSDDNVDDEPANTPFVLAELEDFLRNQDAFCGLLSSLQASLMPRSLASLTRTLLTIPSHTINFLEHYEQSITDCVKCFFEKLSGVRWNWWPLSPSESLLAIGQVRIYYRCHCNSMLWHDVSYTDAVQLKRLVRLKGTQTYGRHLCQSATAFPHEGSLFGSDFARPSGPSPQGSSGINNLPHNLALSNSANQSGPSSGHASSLSTSAHSSHGSVPYSSSSQHVSSVANIPTPLLGYVLFCSNRGQPNLEITHLDIKRSSTDRSFFLDLKKYHFAMRGYARQYFGIWQLSHCEFKKFIKFDALGVFSSGYDLPTCPSYEYEPRKPNAEDPPVNQHIFQTALSRCSPSCPLRWLHRCQSGSTGNEILTLIPKKQGIWAYDAKRPDDKVAWGLEAYHVICGMRVFLYNLILLISPYGFWAYWQGVHPKDMQNASVPTTFAVSMITLFWTLTGIIHVLREPTSSKS